jgi:hypothetical protein
MLDYAGPRCIEILRYSRNGHDIYENELHSYESRQRLLCANNELGRYLALQQPKRLPFLYNPHSSLPIKSGARNANHNMKKVPPTYLLVVDPKPVLVCRLEDAAGGLEPYDLELPSPALLPPPPNQLLPPALPVPPPNGPPPLC